MQMLYGPNFTHMVKEQNDDTHWENLCVSDESATSYRKLSFKDVSQVPKELAFVSAVIIPAFTVCHKILLFMV